VWNNGLQFECTQCHACCRHDPGYVFLSQNDLATLASHLNISQEEFKKVYTRCVDLGSGPILSLKEKTNFDCIFWDKGCTVYSARPLQCSSYPFWGRVVGSEASWKQESHFCPGIGQGKLHSPAEVETWLEKMSKNTPLECCTE